MQFERNTINSSSVAGPQLRTHRAADGYEIVYRLWSPVGGNPRAQILMLHGIQSHGGWYEASCRQLAEAGYEVWFPDRRGSGRNIIDRGDVQNAERWFDDIDEFVTLMARDEGLQTDRQTLPKFILGLSWGAKLAVAHAVSRPFGWTGLILLYPGIYTRIRIKFWQKWAINALCGLGIRKLKISIPLSDSHLFTHTDAARRQIEQDAWSLHEVTVNFLKATLQLERLIPAGPRRLRMPILCQLAGRDEIVNNRRTKSYLQRFQECELTLREYPDACHTLEFEPNRAEITGEMCDWLDQRCPPS
ncbi:MAG: alpha/beta hydrolase [Planctomycetaceae bacterium]